MNPLDHPSRRLVLIISVLVLLSSVYLVSMPHPSVASTSGAGVLIPLYAYPGSMWRGLIQAKESHPSVPVIAVINPDNGPGNYQDPTILAGVRGLQGAGITVVGYVATDYARVSLSSVESSIVEYRHLYGLSGVFFDEMSNVHGKESYYSTLTNYADSHGMWLTVGNPGTGVPSSFIGTVDILCIYENAGLPSLSLISSRTQGYSRQYFAMTPYEVGSVSSSYVSSASNHLGYMYITNGVYPHQYTSLPPYFSSLLSYLSGSARSSSNVALTIKAATTAGAPISGLWATIGSTSGSVIANGFTSFSYAATSGDHYVVSVSNYGDYRFSHWSDGATSNTITVSPTQATTLIAYYTSQSETIPFSAQTGSSWQSRIPILQSVPQTSNSIPTSSPPQAANSSSTVSSQSASGSTSSFAGPWFTMSSIVLVAAVLVLAVMMGFTRRRLRVI